MNEDAIIVERCLRGDARAFGELHEKYAPLLVSVLRKLLKDEHKAHDVVQETFIRLLDVERFKSFRGDCKLSSWLTTIAVNTGKNLLRSKKRDAKIDGERLTKLRSEITPPDVELEQDEATSKIQSALAKLPEDVRKIVLLSQEKSYDEICSELGITSGQLRGTLYRARQELRHVLEKEEV